QLVELIEDAVRAVLPHQIGESFGLRIKISGFRIRPHHQQPFGTEDKIVGWPFDIAADAAIPAFEEVTRPDNPGSGDSPPPFRVDHERARAVRAIDYPTAPVDTWG